ncbi:MAG: signal peptidase I [Methylophilus sp.]|nr:signal peptidase I [Methylophilus sp.]MDP3608724.1 signal peptidase I [Methylophilus sp.]
MYFALFMLVILLITGIIWLLDILFLRKLRKNAAEPWYVEYSKSFFPVILLVFVIRSFLVEPFKIPSGSMMPTLLAGDYILVNKFTYGLRVPILNSTFVEVGEPKRGDVLVFHYPPEPTIDYIKRVVGLPGDVIEYREKRLSVNGKELDANGEDDFIYTLQTKDENNQDRDVTIQALRYQETLGDVKHEILIHDLVNQYEAGSLGAKLMAGESITVPQGHYFAMGDNRDNSSDSRVWGFVPEQNLVGKAFYIWFNFDKFSRIGNTIQ